MRKSFLLGICTVLCMLLFVGCGENNAMFTQSYIILNDDNSLSVTLMEDFTESYYNETELIEMVNTEIADYNSQRGTQAISLGNHSLENGLLSLELKFIDVQAFNDYMPEVLFVGTLEEAVANGYDLNRSLNVVAKDGAMIGKNELQNMGDSRVLILEGVMDVRCPSKITYYSQGMLLLDSTTVSAGRSGVFFVIY